MNGRGRTRGLALLAGVACGCGSTYARAETLPAVVGFLDEQGNRDDPFIDDEPELPAAQTAKRPPPGDHQLRLELGVGGPGGLMAVRYSRVLSTGTRIEPAVGLGYTGVVGSLLVAHPFYERVRQRWGGSPIGATLEIYAGYSASRLTDGLDHPWTGRDEFLPHGTYHWIDVGLSTQASWRNLRWTTGVGVTKLVSGPAEIGGEGLDEETFWFAFPEGWIGKHGIAPALWSSVGYAF